MASPVSETSYTTYNLPGLGTTWQTSDVKNGWTGGDFSTPLPYQRRRGKGQAGLNQFGVYFADGSDSYGQELRFDNPAWQPAKNKAYSRLVDEVNGERSQLGTFFAEWRESFGMVANRAIGLRRAYSSLRRGDFRRFLRELSVSPKRKHRGKVRNSLNEVSGLWLEYWFGWAPSVADIYGSLQQLSEPLPSGIRYQGSAKDSRVSGFRKDEGSWGINVNECHNTFRVRVGGRFSLVNPNLYLASQMGLINPAAIAWEVVPFSFMVDWVVDVSSFIESFTDFAGLEVSQTYHNFKGNYLKERGYIRPGTRQAFLNQTRFERRVGLIRPLPNFGVLSNLGQSKTRAASAVSLLIQVLKT